MLLRKGLQKKGTIATLQVSSRADLLAKVLFMDVEMCHPSVEDYKFCTAVWRKRHLNLR